jgi:hypothetical protein
MKYSVGDILIPVSEYWAEFNSERIEVLGFIEGTNRYRCQWLRAGIPIGDIHQYEESWLDDEQLDETALAMRILKSYEC